MFVHYDACHQCVQEPCCPPTGDQDHERTQPPTLRVEYQTAPRQYRHWKLKFEGPVATLAADFDENGGLRPGYKLKLNSYDLGVDIELNDAINRIRFEHPEVRTVVVTSAKEKVFCSGANIFMLGVSSHAWKVNFCKFTNETRNGLEDLIAHSGLKFLAAVNGACAGGGYELALACDEIILVDDRSSAVSLPEVPLLGVLPGTGGLTRVTDKRKVRHDLADIFCTTSRRRARPEGQGLAPGGRDGQAAEQFAAKVQERALELAQQSDRPCRRQGRVAAALAAHALEADALRYERTSRSRSTAPSAPPPVHGEGRPPARSRPTSPASRPPAPTGTRCRWRANWKTRFCSMRTNELEIGTAGCIKTEGDALPPCWRWTPRSLREVTRTTGWCARRMGLLRRTFSRLDLSSRSLFALIEPGSCFAGSFLELALACDRSYHLATADDEDQGAEDHASATLNFGLYPMVTGQSRLQRRFYASSRRWPPCVRQARQAASTPTPPSRSACARSNPTTSTGPTRLRIAIEERVSMSPDALTGMEANLRFNGPENMFTRVFGRLTAWQNWIFQRPNAVGEQGAR